MSDQPPRLSSPGVLQPSVLQPSVLQPSVLQPIIAQSLPNNSEGLASRHMDQGYSLVAAWLWLSGSLTILVLAAIMSVGPARRIYLPGLSVPIPETCMMHARFGIDCPGCGLTRSFIHFAHGRILEGLSLNPAGIAIFLFVAAQVPAALLRFVLGRSSRFAIMWTRCNEIALVALPTLTLVQWIVRLVMGDYR